ncbi:MAG: acetate kinase [Tindallia sp. MSAO_Bac2]|nr:MAG: acetate kinase [Tindallia sp. MSAO_Bac2]
MKVLVLNCGSSSLKYQIINMENEELLAKGIAERIGLEGSFVKHEPSNGEKEVIETELKDHKDAIKVLIDALLDSNYGVLSSMDEINAVGHRVVHAGEKFSGSVMITQDVIDALEECSDLAPLHNPPNLMGIYACQEIMPNTPMVGVFDTAFHQTMPPSSYLYALPYELYDKYKIRRYGFHGTSHKYVALKTAEMLGQPLEELNVVTCHLGNGASMAAVQHGKSVDTTMGFTPLEGLVMGTRCGDIDPAIISYIMDKENMSIDDVNNIMNKKSGVLGISGVSSDFRDIEEAAEQGNERAKIALEIFYKKVTKYIGAYAAEMGGLDAIVFTAGLGENSDTARKQICKSLSFMGATIDDSKNDGVRGKETIVSTDDSKVKIVLMPTNEELMIARETKSLV